MWPTAQAHLYFVPVYAASLFMWPISKFADEPYLGRDKHENRRRSHQGALLMKAALQYIQRHYPFWDASVSRATPTAATAAAAATAARPAPISPRGTRRLHMANRLARFQPPPPCPRVCFAQPTWPPACTRTHRWPPLQRHPLPSPIAPRHRSSSSLLVIAPRRCPSPLLLVGGRAARITSS